MPNIHLESFLLSDTLRHITPLKMLSLYRAHARVISLNVANETGYVLVIPRAVSQYDTAKYPSASRVVFPALNADPSVSLLEAAARVIVDATCDEPFVLKTIDAALVTTLRNALGDSGAMRYARALCSLMPREDFVASYGLQEVEISSHISADAQLLLNAHDTYSASELQTMFATGDARCWVRYATPTAGTREAVAVALTFPNTPKVHEMGSLYVQPHARRAGHAQALVHAAAVDLRERDLPMRYVVDAENAASIALAERCGLRETMRLEHWLVA
jgi:ribosomal protein S18 acetylase RimI-like enzyme